MLIGLLRVSFGVFTQKIDFGKCYMRIAVTLFGRFFKPFQCFSRDLIRLRVLQEKFALEQCRNRQAIRKMFDCFFRVLCNTLPQFVLKAELPVCRNKSLCSGLLISLWEYSKSGELEYW